MAAEVTARPYDRPSRTQALPKHSLFGAEIQKIDDEDKRQMDSLDLKEWQKSEDRQRAAKQQRYRAKLPGYLRKSMPDCGIEMTKQEIEKQLAQTSRAKNLLNVIEEKSRFFQLGTTDDLRSQSGPPRPDQWLTEKDIEHAGEINRVGVKSGVESYNRDKYQSQPPQHQYSLIGDPMKKGMDFDQNDFAATKKPTLCQYKRHRAPDWLPKEAYMPGPRKEEADPLPISLPPNIQHQFGTNICKSVLKDKNLIDRTLEEQEKIKASFYRPRGKDSAPKLPETKTSPEYEGLSQAFRQNTFPGYTHSSNRSLMKSTYTKKVFDNRVPDPDEWRHERDELSMWAEQNVIREKVKKEWDSYQMEKTTKK